MVNGTNPFLLLGPEFYGFLLPWIFTFAVVYGLVNHTGPFAGKKGVAAALALVAAFFVTAVGGPQMAAFFSSLFGGSAIFLGGILVIILFMTLANVNFGETSKMIVLIVLVLLGIVLFLASSGTAVGFTISPDLAALIFWGVIILAVIWMVAYREKPAAAPAKPE